jgi:2-keto-4-pentenoate hydratase
MHERSEVHRTLARRLFDAEASGELLDANSLGFEDLDAIQSEVALLRRAGGKAQVGWKTMGTNPSLLAARGGRMTEPGRGYLFEPVLAGSVVSLPSGRSVFAEPEISLVLQHDVVGPGVTAAHVLAATNVVCASIEVAWSRFEGRPSPVALVTDNAGAARVVLSSLRVPVNEVHDLSRVSVEFLKNGEVVQTGAGTNVLGSPANAVAWERPQSQSG